MLQIANHIGLLAAAAALSNPALPLPAWLPWLAPPSSKVTRRTAAGGGLPAQRRASSPLFQRLLFAGEEKVWGMGPQSCRALFAPQGGGGAAWECGYDGC